MKQISATELRPFIRTIADYPRPGIQFRDITTLLGNAQALRATIAALAAPWADAGITHVAGIEARGFIFGAAVACQLGAGFVPLRKQGKLPHTTVMVEYSLEYGTDQLEMHADGVTGADRVLLVDDLIATGGSAAAGIRLLRSLDATVVGATFVIDLPDLGGTARLEQAGIRTLSLVRFDGH
ncbi:MAG TPA: adenine phosphoribosyltransferase [Steroidobacteraceae bacterium]|jgi:adenine phosphoribosyltransferase|nr:adenine phosphoribosyltransferase [Steroidobacteraceae bacterium]